MRSAGGALLLESTHCTRRSGGIVPIAQAAVSVDPSLGRWQIPWLALAVPAAVFVAAGGVAADGVAPQCHRRRHLLLLRCCGGCCGCPGAGSSGALSRRCGRLDADVVVVAADAAVAAGPVASAAVASGALP